MFKWKRFFRQQFEVQPENFQSSEHQHIWAVKAPEVLLSEPLYQEKLQAIKQQLSIIEEDYEKLYLPLIYQFAAYIQELPYSLNTIKENASITLLEYALTLSLNTLKIRRGFMLPLGADTETCYQQQGLWTYAVFTGGLLETCWQVIANYKIELFDKNHKSLGIWEPLITSKISIGHFYQYAFKSSESIFQSFNSILAKTIIPEQGFFELSSHKILFANLCDHLNGHGKESNPITQIIQEAKQRNFKNSNSAIILQNTHHEKLEENSENAVCFKEPSQENYKVSLENQHRELSSSTESNFVVNSFLSWLKEPTTSEIQPAILYRVESGILICISQAWSLFQKQRKEDKNFSENDFIKYLIDAEIIILNSVGLVKHRYFKGEWQARCIIEGIIVKIEYLSHLHLPFATDLQPHLF